MLHGCKTLKTDLLIDDFSKVANRSILGKLLCDPFNYRKFIIFIQFMTNHKSVDYIQGLGGIKQQFVLYQSMVYITIKELVRKI